jgi:predicted NAD/FAD-binding protein
MVEFDRCYWVVLILIGIIAWFSWKMADVLTLLAEISKYAYWHPVSNTPIEYKRLLLRNAGNPNNVYIGYYFGENFHYNSLENKTPTHWMYCSNRILD